MRLMQFGPLHDPRIEVNDFVAALNKIAEVTHTELREVVE